MHVRNYKGHEDRALNWYPTMLKEWQDMWSWDNQQTSAVDRGGSWKSGADVPVERWRQSEDLWTEVVQLKSTL